MSSPVILFGRIPEPGEPTQAQKDAGTYRKRKVPWQGLTLMVENEAGTFRRGTGGDGTRWETLLMWSYGYVARTEGVDGDEVDVYLGPQIEDAPMVYVVHQRCYGDWDKYDEDKAMLGFMSEGEARDAFLACYDDPRFLGPITAMPVAEFVAKVKGTRGAPAMIKAILFLKSRVAPYIRGGRTVRGYDRRDQMDLFADAGHAAAHEPAGPPSGSPTVARRQAGAVAPDGTREGEARSGRDDGQHTEESWLAADWTDRDWMGDQGLSRPGREFPEEVRGDPEARRIMARWAQAFDDTQHHPMDSPERDAAMDLDADMREAMRDRVDAVRVMRSRLSQGLPAKEAMTKSAAVLLFRS